MADFASLSGQVAVVTGGSSGLGRAAAASLAAAGVNVAVLARSRADLEETVREIAGISRTATVLAVPVDLGESIAVKQAIDQVRAELGPVDILVNAAGTDVPGPIETLDPADWDRVLNVNLRAVFLLSKAVLPDMRSRGGGTIINISSVAGRRGWANASAYCASKFALTGLTQALAAEGKEHRIKVSLLYPGGMDTSWGSWTPSERGPRTAEADPAMALPPTHVAELITWIAASHPDMVLNEITVTPMLEQGWP
ncbi:SDR family oxidoreductase [Arthrobacter sp. D1-17]